ncbi:MAG: response regulator [Desulfobacterales bacterium]
MEILKVRPDIPTILCTGFSEKIDEEKSKKIGFHKYIEKPIDRRNLAMLVRQALNEKEAAAFFS